VNGLNERKKPKADGGGEGGGDKKKEKVKGPSTPENEGRFTSFIVSPDGTSADKNAMTEAMEKAAEEVKNDPSLANENGIESHGNSAAITKGDGAAGAGCCIVM